MSLSSVQCIIAVGNILLFLKKKKTPNVHTFSFDGIMNLYRWVFVKCVCTMCNAYKKYIYFVVIVVTSVSIKTVREIDCFNGIVFFYGGGGEGGVRHYPCPPYIKRLFRKKSIWMSCQCDNIIIMWCLKFCTILSQIFNRNRPCPHVFSNFPISWKMSSLITPCLGRTIVKTKLSPPRYAVSSIYVIFNKTNCQQV